jgi:hypothetical protein
MVILDNVSEWELLDPYDRVSRILTHICTSFFLSAGIAVLFCAIPLTINHVNDTPLFSNEVLRIIAIISSTISVLIVFGVRSSYFIRTIMESKMRMANLSYLKLLKDHDLLKMSKG